MREAIGLTVLLLILLAAPLSAVMPIMHDIALLDQALDAGDQNLRSSGYGGLTPARCSVPGFFVIDPGTNWENFIGAAQDGVPYTIKNVTLCKQTPSIIQCAETFPAQTVCQQGTANIRLLWPLMYEVPGTIWTLTVLYGTAVRYDDDGADGNPAGFVHTEIWQWQVDASLESLKVLMRLFRQSPFGTSEVGLISDEWLFPILIDEIDAVEAAVEDQDLVIAGLIIGDFEMMVMDACITESPESPSPTGIGSGIANSLENPACCKLLADAEFIGFDLGILQPAKQPAAPERSAAHD